MANTFKVINCKIEDAESQLNENAEDWALSMFIPAGTGRTEFVTIVMISKTMLARQQLMGARGN